MRSCLLRYWYIYTLEEKLGAIGCDHGNVEMQWNNIKECMLDITGDVVGKVERRARKPWITQEMVSKMDEIEGNGRMSTLEKTGRSTGGWGMNWK